MYCLSDGLGTYEAKRIGLAYSFSMTYEEIQEMIELALKEEKYLQTISIRKTK